jgi:Mrp family chromosome partitioning ATPase
MATNDAVDLLDLVDDVVLVLKAGKTTAHAADRAAEMLERRRSHVLGVAITGVDSRNSDDYYYYYGSYYYDGEGNRKSRRAAARKAKDGGRRRWFARKSAEDRPDDAETDVEVIVELTDDATRDGAR